MTNRKFYKTIIKLEVLSEEPFECMSLGDIHHMITDGDCSGSHELVDTLNLNGKEAADALKAQGSDPEFFQIDENGNDIE